MHIDYTGMSNCYRLTLLHNRSTQLPRCKYSSIGAYSLIYYYDFSYQVFRICVLWVFVCRSADNLRVAVRPTILCGNHTPQQLHKKWCLIIVLFLTLIACARVTVVVCVCVCVTMLAAIYTSFIRWKQCTVRLFMTFSRHDFVETLCSKVLATLICWPSLPSLLLDELSRDIDGFFSRRLV